MAEFSEARQSGEPALGMSRGPFLPLLDTTEYLAAHIHEAAALWSLQSVFPLAIQDILGLEWNAHRIEAGRWCDRRG